MRAVAGEARPIADIAGVGSLRGLHNAQNAACATAAALALGLSPAAIQAGLRSFPGLAHRMEEVGRSGNVLFVNNSKATNANSAAKRLSVSTIFSGSPAASRRPAASNRCAASSRGSARPI